MPKIQKQFHLELTVEQFLSACSLIELQEIDLQLDTYLKKAEHDARLKAYREGSYSELTDSWRKYYEDLEKKESTEGEDKPSEPPKIGFDEEF